MFHLAVIIGVALHWTFIHRMVRRYAAVGTQGQPAGYPEPPMGAVAKLA
jgi:hypothetical protein